MLTLYFKLLDNYNDGGFVQRLGSLACKPLVWFAYRKAADVYPETASILYETISRQSLIESERCDSVDQASEPTALALSGLCGQLSEEPGCKRVLLRFGYLLGRYVYLADALDDLEEDVRQGSYNAFLLREHLDGTPSDEQLAAIRENAKGSLFLTIAELEKTYDLLDLQYYKPILDNIVYLGLRDTVERILLPKETKRR